MTQLGLSKSVITSKAAFGRIARFSYENTIRILDSDYTISLPYIDLNILPYPSLI
jgi:hypothetical protein